MKLRNQSCQLILGHYKPKLSTNSRTFQPSPPHFSKQTWLCAFFITSVKSFYRDEKVVRSRGYVFFTTVKIRLVGRLWFLIQ